jgi:hypothetical protein
MVIGPLAVAVVREVIPYGTTGLADHPGVYPLLGTAEVVAVFTMGFAMLGLGRLVQPRAPILALIGTPVALLGWTMIAVLGTVDSYVYEMGQTSIGGAAREHLAAGLMANSEIGLFVGLFILGHLLGTLLLGAGLLVSRRAPTWAGIAVVAGTVAHPIAFLVLGSHLLDAVSYLVLAAGMTMAARAVLAIPNAEWDLAPAPRPRT